MLQESPSYAQSVLAPPVSGGASGGNAWSVFFDGLADAIVIAALVGELIVVLVNMVLRATLSVSFTWSDEASQFSLIVMAFIGGAMSYRRGEHVVVRVITERLPVRVRERVAVLADCLVFGLSVVVAFLGAAATYQDRGIHTPQLHLSQSLFDAPIVIGMTIIAVHVAFGLFRRSRRGVAVIAIATTALAVGAVAANDHWGPLVSGNVVSGASIIMIGVLLLIGVPITFAFICSALVYFSFSGSVSPLSVPVNMQEGVSSFVLLAIPFFVLAGGIMARGGLSTRLADLANVTVGRLRNGLLQVIVVTMYLFSGLSGSKAADMAAVGTGLKDAIRKQGYDRGEIVAVLSASAVMAETVPPSIALLVLASAASLSPSALFLAGIVPALVVALCLMLAIGMRPSQTAVRPAPSSIGTIGKVALRAIPALLMPVILGRGILSGIATPTEMSSVAVIYGLFLAGPIYRQVDAAALWRLLRTSASLTGMVLLVVAAATAFSRSLLLANVPSQIATAFQHLPGGAIGFLIVSTLALVLLGQVLEGIPAILVFAPLVIPIAVQFNINPIHYGIILIVAIGLGAFSPPIGVGLYIACVIGETSIERATRAILPYLLVLLGGLLVIVFVPWFSLALPRLAHLIP